MARSGDAYEGLRAGDAVSEDVWSASDTSPDEIDDALRRLLRERHAQDNSLAPARVLNLVVVVDREWKGEIANRLARVGRYHASRTVLCAVEPGRKTLDARAVMTYNEPSEGIGLLRELVDIDLGPEHVRHLNTIIDPVIVSDLPTVLWCPHGHDPAVESLLGLATVLMMDSDDQPDSKAALERAHELLRSVYVVDLAWLRTTPWRERVAAAFDPSDRRPELERVNAVAVRHRDGSAASALLFAGWLASRLGWRAGTLSAQGNGRGGLKGSAHRGDAEISVEMTLVDQQVPGLGGVTVASDDGFSIALDRSAGGLRARLHASDGAEQTWRLLGASRGEGGILGEGVRQALLRDPTYGPALVAAHAFTKA